MCKLRITAHNLNMESTAIAIEDEYRFITEYPRYKYVRIWYIKRIITSVCYYRLLITHNKIGDLFMHLDS